MFEMKWNMTDRSVKVYNVDAQRMNNRIPKEQYGTSKYNHPYMFPNIYLKKHHNYFVYINVLILF